MKKNFFIAVALAFFISSLGSEITLKANAKKTKENRYIIQIDDASE